MEPVSRKNPFERVRTLLLDRTLLRKAVSFAGVGVVNTLVDFSLFSLFHLYLGWPIIVANVASWSVAVTGSYVMNSLITFAAESQGKLRIKSYASFLVAQLAGLFANTVTVVIASYFVPVLLGKVVAIGVTFAVNFSLSHFVIFRAHRPKPQ
jgi:putative flippase GtrA